MRSLLLLLAGAVLGILAIGAARYATLPPDATTHFHANLAVFVDGERLDLSDDRYMEDVAACVADPTQQRPEDRVHLHDNNPDVVHVHATGVTWGHLFANLGFGVGDDYLFTDQGVRHGPGAPIAFVLNGTRVPSIRNLPIRSTDRLLVSVNPPADSAALAEQFAQVAANAGEYNEKADPGACAGGHVPDPGERLRRAFWF